MARGLDPRPAEDRLTDYGSTSFDGSALGSLSTAPVPWDRTEHVAFEMPRSARRGKRRDRTSPRAVERMITLGLLLVTFVVAALVFTFGA